MKNIGIRTKWNKSFLEKSLDFLAGLSYNRKERVSIQHRQGGQALL